MTFRTISKTLRVASAALLLSTALEAEEPAVPVGLQAELTAKIAGYDRNFAARAGSKARVVIVSKSGDVESVKVANQARAAFAAVPDIGGVAHEEAVMPFTSAAALADEVSKHKTSILYVSTGLSAEMPAIADALNGKDVVTVSALAADVPRGSVIGFDLVSGKPKLLVHLTQAKKQNAAFKAEALKLMKVFE